MKFVAPLNAHVYMLVCIEVDTLLVESRLDDHIVEGKEEEEDFIRDLSPCHIPKFFKHIRSQWLINKTESYEDL